LIFDGGGEKLFGDNRERFQAELIAESEERLQAVMVVDVVFEETDDTLPTLIW